MDLARWTLALTLLGLDAVVLTRAWGMDRHCDYTRPGVEPWWDDQPGEGAQRVTTTVSPAPSPGPPD